MGRGAANVRFDIKSRGLADPRAAPSNLLLFPVFPRPRGRAESLGARRVIGAVWGAPGGRHRARVRYDASARDPSSRLGLEGVGPKG